MLFFEYFETFIGILEVAVTFILIKISHHCEFLWRGEVIFQYEFPRVKIEERNILARDTFPKSFFFGVAIDYHPENVWGMNDRMESATNLMTLISHQTPYNEDHIEHRTYQEYQEIIALAKYIKAKMTRISLRWSDLLPNGLAGPVNEDAVELYNDIIDEILANDLTPMVTLFYSDTPYLLRQLGGWINPMMVEWFEEYARVAFASLGDKVKYWVTVEDPVTLCTRHYGNSLMPSANLSGIADYLCGHHVLLAHARVYHLYQKVFKKRQKGKVGIIQNYTWFYPEDCNSKYDRAAVEAAFQWYNGWLTNPLFGKNGDYPKLMRDRLSFKSKIQEFPTCRLPSFTKEEIRKMRSSADFLGVNFYASKRVHGLNVTLEDEVSFDRDAAIRVLPMDDQSTGTWIKNTSQTLGKLLRYLNRHYIVPEIHITASGYEVNDKIDAVDRIAYHRQSAREVFKAMQSGVDVRSYLAQNLLDDFEWAHANENFFDVILTDPGTALTTSHCLATEILDIYKTTTIGKQMEISERMCHPLK